MYFNNVHILFFVAISIIGMIVGKFLAWCNMRMPERKKIFSKEFFAENKKGLEYNYVSMIVIAILYIALLYRFGINTENVLKNLELIKFMILVPMLILAFGIDIKHRIIPNRLNLCILEVGLIITFIYGITNVNMAKDYILGMLAGGSIFGIITLLGALIAGKEAMGLGDVKYTAVLGLYYGVNTIAEISLLSFFIAAVCSIVILIIRVCIFKNKDEYIPFGPFLSIAALACIFMPSNFVFDNFLFICKMIGDKIPII